MIAADRQLQTDFLSGTGEMGALIRAHNWEDTPLGPLEDWPASLKNSVSLMLNSRHPMWIGWGAGLTFVCNAACLPLLAADKGERALGRPASEVWAEIWDVCGPVTRNVFETGEASLVEDIRCSFSCSPIRDESGRVAGVFCLSTGVTSAIPRSFRTLIDALPAAIYTTDAEGRITHFNPAAARLTARTPRLETDRWSIVHKLFRPDGRPLANDRSPLAICLKGDLDCGEFECIGERPDGSRFWFTSYPALLRDAEGRVTGGIDMLVDNTARRSADSALSRSEDRFRGIFESSAVGISILTPDYRFSETNHALSAITGYSEAELSQLDYLDLVHPDYRDAMNNLAGQLVSGEIPALTFEQRCVTKSGETIWAKNSVSAIRDGLGEPEYLILLCEDITARKQAEAALRDSEERFRAMVDTTPNCVKVVAPDGTLLFMNSTGLTMLGANSPGALTGKCVFDVIAPEFRDEYRAFHESICLGAKASLEFEVIGLTGRRRRLETHAAPLPRADGTNSQLAVTHDITDREDRQRDRNLLGAIVDSSDDAIISKDLNGIITSWNNGAQRTFGYTADETLGKSITILVPPDRLQEEPEILSRLRKGQRIDHFETVRRRKDGTLLDISLTISPVKDEHGRIVGASKIARDVTQHRRAEKSIQELNAQLTFELSAMERIQGVSTRLAQSGDFTEVLGEIVEAGIAIAGADMGNIQLLEGNNFKIVAQRGFEKPFLDFSDTVGRYDAACGAALTEKQRVVVQDVAASPLFTEPARAAMLEA